MMLATACAVPAVARAADPSAGAAPAKAEAQAHFDRGLKLYDAGAWAAALAEFVEARRLHPLRNAVYQAGLCLEKLERYDEALDRFEAMLREFGGEMPPAAREIVQRKVIEVRGLVGEVTVEAAEPGATITVDGLPRGEHPLLAPLRVAAGSHLVRVWKTGFEPFEARVTVAGGQLAGVSARLAPLGPYGRVRIAEQGGRTLDVLVDATRVGATPWEGPLSPGPHVVALRGEGDLGTPPIPIEVERDRTTPITLVAEELAAALRIEPVPVNASVAVDGVTLGRGVWEGRLRAGDHKIEIASPGFLTAAKAVALGRDERRDLRVELVRDPASPFWPKPPRRARFVAEIGEAAALAPALGGEVTRGCVGDCREGPAAGGYVIARGGYELGSGLGFGVAAGWLTIAQSTAQRPAAARVVGLHDDAALADDSLRLSGVLAGAWASLRIDTRFPIHLRLGAGALVGAVTDARRGLVTLRTGAAAPFGVLTETHPARFAYVAPEVRLGLPLGPRVELSLALEALVLIAASRPRWDETHAFGAATDGVASFPADTLLGPAIVVLTPGLRARYDF
jgi:hypothetical protein